MLSNAEIDQLYEIIIALLGEDKTLATYKRSFNETTVGIVEKMVEANFQCNVGMRELITELIGGASTLAKGWLRPLLRTGNKVISVTELKGYGCLAASKAKWKGAILTSTIYSSF